MYTYMTVAQKYDGTTLAHVPCVSYFQACNLAAALHNACPCVVEIRFYCDGKMLSAEEC